METLAYFMRTTETDERRVAFFEDTSIEVNSYLLLSWSKHIIRDRGARYEGYEVEVICEKALHEGFLSRLRNLSHDIEVHIVEIKPDLPNYNTGLFLFALYLLSTSISFSEYYGYYMENHEMAELLYHYEQSRILIHDDFFEICKRLLQRKITKNRRSENHQIQENHVRIATLDSGTFT